MDVTDVMLLSIIITTAMIMVVGVTDVMLPVHHNNNGYDHGGGRH